MGVILARASEAPNHLLLWYPLSFPLWCTAYGLLGVIWVMERSVADEIRSGETVTTCSLGYLSSYLEGEE